MACLREMLEERETAEPALYAIKGCCEMLGGRAEPFMVPFLPKVLHLVADKKSQAVRTAASETGPAIIDIVVPHATRNVQSLLFAGISEDNWHTKLLALRLLGQFADRKCLVVCVCEARQVPCVVRAASLSGVNLFVLTPLPTFSGSEIPFSRTLYQVPCSALVLISFNFDRLPW